MCFLTADCSRLCGDCHSCNLCDNKQESLSLPEELRGSRRALLTTWCPSLTMTESKVSTEPLVFRYTVHGFLIILTISQSYNIVSTLGHFVPRSLVAVFSRSFCFYIYKFCTRAMSIFFGGCNAVIITVS